MKVVIVEEEVEFTLVELSRVCRADTATLATLVDEGVLTPIGNSPQTWLFDGGALRRARLALRLTHDLELNTAATALVLNLIDEIAALKTRLRRLGRD